MRTSHEHFFRSTTRWLLPAVVTLMGCDSTGGGADTGPAAPDAGFADAAADAKVAEGGIADSGRDGGPASPDATNPDAAEVDAGPPDSGVLPDCLEAVGTDSADTRTWTEAIGIATVAVIGGGCERTFALRTTATLRDGVPISPRVFTEQPGQSSLHTKNDLFDALYALSLDEVRELSVDEISDGSFNNGRPIACPAGGCFETGRLWPYVWTRDTAYAVDLGLAVVDPLRARNSLEFKLSDRRGGGSPQIVQDTGTGGSYPVSSDRVVWALGAWTLAKYLDGAERDTFVRRAFEALSNTVEHDREVVFDPEDGIYRGEQSFLDWREQTYPDWTASDVVHIGMSKALSTNVAHLRALRIAAEMAGELGDDAARTRYDDWANQLKTAIHDGLYLPDRNQYATFLNTTMDPSPARHYDLLGSALAVLADLGSDSERGEVVANYPHLPMGPPVIWPQQREVPIYHNRALWPFVTAYWLRAARAVRNDAAVNHNVRSLMRGTALNLSNMENFEAVTGRPEVDDGPLSGPVVNSQRQLWSVAGYLSMVHDVLFGMEATQTGIRFVPYVTRELRHTLFEHADTLVLNALPYRGRRITVEIVLPDRSNSRDGAYAIGSVHLDGRPVADAYLAPADLAPRSHVRIELADTPEPAKAITLVTDVTDDKNLFAPLSPVITALALDNGRIRIDWDARGEPTADELFSVYRDGQRVVEGLTGSTNSWTDASSSANSPSYCYAVEATYRNSLNTSQHSAPWCYWGPNGERVASFDAGRFQATGGVPVTNHGRFHYERWGDPGHQLAVARFRPVRDGLHWLQVVAGNGAGPVNTGVTCAVKRIDIEDATTRQPIASGFLFMPHQSGWDVWRDSNLIPVDLRASEAYNLIIRGDDFAVNMSTFDHFELYTGGLGGHEGPLNRVNVAELKVLAR